MASIKVVNIHLSYRTIQVLALSIPIDDIKRLSIRPLKWLRYVAFAVFGATGRLALTADGSAIEDENITWEFEDQLREDYYYIPDGALHLVDYQGLNDRMTSSVTEAHLSSFRQSIIRRDGDGCVFTGAEVAYCEAIHILPRCKGHEYIQAVHQDRRHAYSDLPPPILEFESSSLESIDCDENGILVRMDLHSMHAHGAIAFLKTPNFALNPEDIPRVEEDPENIPIVEEGDMPTTRITLQHIRPLQGRDRVAQCDAHITGSGNPPVSTIILDYVYGVAAFKRWAGGPGVEKMMKARFEALYKSIPPLPRSSSPEFSDDNISDDDPNDADCELKPSGTGNKHRRHHRCHTSDSMLRAMDTVLALSMYIKGNTLESLAAERERYMEEAELRAQEASSVKVKQWLQE
ncbi:hypothetical protein EDD18DRAFT_1287147 [Armillaria luteobubalina]|uniref:HNH nuclease domain-containing protein n=1 Tax=Armillaria luteobubalina TaxID=153913 RepID=A0AA39Q439_9AGAR|nr:hypothetical protein EDD18DRAFT_1287147 [Armillaria luteobubalina]